MSEKAYVERSWNSALRRPEPNKGLMDYFKSMGQRLAWINCALSVLISKFPLVPQIMCSPNPASQFSSNWQFCALRSQHRVVALNVSLDLRDLD